MLFFAISKIGDYMNISLTPELEKYIQDKVSCGLYTSASEVVRESLRLMHTYDDIQKKRISELSSAIDLGVEQIKNGRYIDGEVSRKKMLNKIDKIVKGK